MAMSWPVDCGFFERMTTGPADAVAVDFTKLSPLAATSISTTWPPAALDTACVAEEPADDNADEIPPVEGTPLEAPPPDDEPQPAATNSVAAAATMIRLNAGAMMDIAAEIPPDPGAYTSASRAIVPPDDLKVPTSDAGKLILTVGARKRDSGRRL
jgi:hypothetical protein